MMSGCKEKLIRECGHHFKSTFNEFACFLLLSLLEKPKKGGQLFERAVSVCELFSVGANPIAVSTVLFV